MTLPLNITASMGTPPVEGQPDCPFPINFTAQYEHRVAARYTLVGAGTQVVDFGSLAATGAKAIAITVDPDPSPAAQPVQVTINGGAETWEFDVGGFLLYGNPDPTAAGILAMSIAHAADVKMYVWIFG